MFSRRRRSRAPSFEERLRALRTAGFEVGAGAEGLVRVGRGSYSAILEEVTGAPPRVVLAGRLMAGDIARLVDAGFQKFWRLPQGREVPALAAHLGELHAFQEDLREALDLTSLYHASLGSTSHLHRYDRSRGAPALASSRE